MDMHASCEVTGMETLDKARITHLFKVGILASLLALSADMILGWGGGG